MNEEPLYNRNRIKIGIHPTSVQDHFLTIGNEPNDFNYLIQRGILMELAESDDLRAIKFIRRLWGILILF